MDITSSSKWKELTRKIGVIEDKETYQEALALFYVEFGYRNMIEPGTIPNFIKNFELDTKLHISYGNVREDLRLLEKDGKIPVVVIKKMEKIKNLIPVIDNKETYLKSLKLLYSLYGETLINTFIKYFQLNTKLHITYNDVVKDLVEIKLESITKTESIDDAQSYWEALKLLYLEIEKRLYDKEELIRNFISVYQLSEKLHISFYDVQNDLTKIKLKKEIATITDTLTYKEALELYYENFEDYMFHKEMIQEFIDTYHLDTLLHIGFSDIWNDLAKIKFEDDIEIITDKQSYLECLELYYNEFEDKILFDEEIISKFISTYHLDTRFHITPNNVWNDLSQIKRQSKIEEKIIDEIGTVEDIESYKEALELYYNVFGENMFEIDKVQKFIDTFELYNIDITSNTVYRDLRSIKSAFGSRDEISQSNFTSLHPDIKPAETIAPPIQTQRNQTQNINAIQPEEDDHDYLEKRDVDKDFGKKVDGHEDFYFYVINMSDTELINTINNQYKNIKGSWTLVPRMGEYGSVEFAVVLLLWKYAVNNFSKNPESYASLQIMLGDVICCAFFGMSAGEWSDKVDPIINAHTEIVSYEEFGNVYNYLRNNHIDKIHSLEFNNGNMQDEVYKQFYARFIEIYNSTDEFSEMLDFYTSKGLKIKDDIHFKIVN